MAKYGKLANISKKFNKHFLIIFPQPFDVAQLAGIPWPGAIRILPAIHPVVANRRQPRQSNEFAGAGGARFRCEQQQVHGHLSDLRPVMGDPNGCFHFWVTLDRIGPQ